MANTLTSILFKGGKTKSRSITVDNQVGTDVDQESRFSGGDVKRSLPFATFVYIAPNGNDGNTGLTSGSPVLTFKKAVEIAESNAINNILIVRNGHVGDLEFADNFNINPNNYTQGILRIYSDSGDTIVPGNDSSTVLLLHLDEDDGDTTTVDDSAGGSTHTMTFTGSAEIDEDEKKFGMSSLLIPDTSSTINTPDSADFEGVQKYTWDFWIYPRGFAGGSFENQILRKVGAYRISLVGNNIRCAMGAGYNQTSTTPMVSNTWQHIAMVYDGTQATNADRIKIYHNGISQAVTTSGTIATTIPDTSNVFEILKNQTTTGGYNFDEIRLSKDILRYTASFTPNSQAYDAPVPLATAEEGVLKFDNTLLPETDGVDFTSSGFPATVDLLMRRHDVSTDQMELIVAVDNDGLYSSADGITWSNIYSNALISYGNDGSQDSQDIWYSWNGHLYMSAYGGLPVTYSLVRTDGTTTTIPLAAESRPIWSVESYNGRLYIINAATDTPTTSEIQYSDDGSSWSSGATDAPYGQLINHKGVLYLISFEDNKVYTVSADGQITEFADNSESFNFGNFGQGEEQSWFASIEDYVIIIREDLTENALGSGIMRISRSTDLKTWENITLETGTDSVSPNSTDVPKIWIDRVEGVLYIYYYDGTDTNMYRTVDGENFIRLDKFFDSLHPVLQRGYLWAINSNTLRRAIDSIVGVYNTNILFSGIRLDGNNEARCAVDISLDTDITLEYCNALDFENKLFMGVNTYQVLRLNNTMIHGMASIISTIRDLFDVDFNELLLYDFTDDILITTGGITQDILSADHLTIYNSGSLFNINTFNSSATNIIKNTIFEKIISNDVKNNSNNKIQVLNSLLDAPSVGIINDSTNKTGDPLFQAVDEDNYELQVEEATAANGEYYLFDSIAKGLADDGYDAGCFLLTYSNNDSDVNFQILSNYNPANFPTSFILKRYTESENLNGNVKRSHIGKRQLLTLPFGSESVQDLKHFYDFVRILEETQPISVYFNFNTSFERGGQFRGSGLFTSDPINNVFQLVEDTESFVYDRYRGFWVEIDFSGTIREYFIERLEGNKFTLKDFLNHNISFTDLQVDYKISFINCIIKQESIEAFQMAFDGFVFGSNKMPLQGYELKLEAYHGARQ